MTEINIYGTLNNATPDGVIAKAEQIKDSTQGKKQSEINADYKKRIETLETGGGTGSGTTDYNDLTNKPQINGHELSGNKSASDLGLQAAGDYALKAELESATPIIGENGNWYVGGVDTNVSATGPKGDKGDKGEQGNSGVSGTTDNIVVVNNLNGGESTLGNIKVLAAEQGKVLNEKLTELSNKTDNLESQKLNKSESPQKDTEEDGAFLCNEKGEVFARYVNGKFEAVGIGNTIIPTGPSNKSKYDNIRKDELNEEEELILSDIPDCKNYYTIGACIGITNMGTIELCKGQKDYSKGDILIDSVNIKEIRDGGSTNVIPHGLTITESIIVTIIKKTSTTKINIINADGRSFSGELKYFNGCQGREIKMIAKNGNYKNVSICFSGTWFLKDTWIFGNSYTDFWPKIAYELGFENFGLDGYSGRTSLSALESLKLEIKYGLPKKVVWMMGMNDPDAEDSVNQNWKKAFEDAMEICETNSIQFIPCTIPNVPERIHTYKNSVIRESGLQYIDIASAVGANEKGSGWYDGLLGNDNVHPTNIEGSRVITYALAAGVPSITQ